MMNSQGLIFAIERASLHDGPGLRTTVFLKGCPLHCLWCHNPESQSFAPELYYFREKCMNCGGCKTVCAEECHQLSSCSHEIFRDRCSGCGECVRVCPYSALELKGEIMDVDSVIAVVEQDLDFYQTSGGGLTISGGEPMAQFDFTNALVSHSHMKGIHTCMETSGFAATEKYMKIKDKVDIFLYDFKESDPHKHKQYMGADNALILKNLFELDRHGSDIILRCPIIPGMNDRPSHFQAIADIAGQLEHILEINLMPYHPLGKSKSKRIGKEYPLEEIDFAEMEQVTEWMEFIQKNTDISVKKG